MSDIIEFVKLATAGGEVGWHPRHLYRVLTEPRYRHLDPRPPISRLGGRGYNMLLSSDWEPFKQRLADDALNSPKKVTNLSKTRHQARIDRDREAAAAP